MICHVLYYEQGYLAHKKQAMIGTCGVVPPPPSRARATSISPASPPSHLPASCWTVWDLGKGSAPEMTLEGSTAFMVSSYPVVRVWGLGCWGVVFGCVSFRGFGSRFELRSEHGMRLPRPTSPPPGGEREIGSLLPNNQSAPCTSRKMCCLTHCASHYAPCQPLLRAFFG